MTQLTNTKESGFEEYIEDQLVSGDGYRKRSRDFYNKGLCLDTELLLEFIQATQEKAWGKLEGQHGDAVQEKFFQRLDEEIQERGLLDVLRGGVSDHGVKIDLAYFKPQTGLNPETQALYDNNILSVMRQVKYSTQYENSLDMVLFVNGIPIITIELKNQLTGQSVKNGMAQYRHDRDYRENLFKFKRCLAHFAIDTELAYMTTKLAGLKTYFLPFNKGNNNAAGNPVNPNGYKTEYIWADILKKDILLDIVDRFMTVQIEEREKEDGKTYKVETLIFPRYHQLDTVRRIEKDAKEFGLGKNYLIQHSAGSGKSNTIAWLAHRLAELHAEDDSKIFDSIIVVTDRRILDKQLRETVMQFAQTEGVVKPVIEGSKELQEALEAGEKIIITTLQKFPVIVANIGALPGKKFAVIIDEAHSSQTGESSKNLREVLGDLDEAEREEGSVITQTLEDMVLKQVRARKGKMKNMSFFAFTATPKQKTLELFGVQDPINGKFYPFSLYSMKQAVEEGFIMDVLQNYTTFQVYFSLLKKIHDDPEFSKKKTQKLLLSYVEKHEHAIEKKVEAMISHFANNIAQEIDGRAKAMIVTKSRLHAVRFKKAMDAYLRDRGHSYKALVAFSGTVKDGGVEYTESQMNRFSDKHTAQEFKKDIYKFLIVAEKYQTGFDQPLLSVMYVDKKLSDVNAVQTLSRLNRTYPGKERVFVLDFVNDAEDIKEAFAPYYTTTVLSEATDPNLLHNLERDLYGYKMFSQKEVEGFVEDYFNGVKPAALNSFLDEVISRFDSYLPEEKEEFRGKAVDYIRKYGFMSQIISFEDTNLEMLYIFCKMLKKKLPLDKERLPLEVLEAIDIESYKITKKEDVSIRFGDKEGELYPMESGGHSTIQDEQDQLSRIIGDINDRFGTDFSLDDKVILQNLSQKLIKNSELEGSIKNNTRDAAKLKFEGVFQGELINMLNSHFDLYKKLDQSHELKQYVREKLFDYVHDKIYKV